MAWVMLHGFKKGVSMIERWVKIQIIAPKASNVESCIIIIGDEQKTSRQQSVSLKSNLILNNLIFLSESHFRFMTFIGFIPFLLTLSRYKKIENFTKFFMAELVANRNFSLVKMVTNQIFLPLSRHL